MNSAHSSDDEDFQEQANNVDEGINQQIFVRSIHDKNASEDSRQFECPEESEQDEDRALARSKVRIRNYNNNDCRAEEEGDKRAQNTSQR